MNTFASLFSSVSLAIVIMHRKFSFLKTEQLLQHCLTRGKEILEQLPCEQFPLGFEIYRAFLLAKQVG